MTWSFSKMGSRSRYNNLVKDSSLWRDRNNYDIKLDHDVKHYDDKMHYKSNVRHIARGSVISDCLLVELQGISPATWVSLHICHSY